MTRLFLLALLAAASACATRAEVQEIVTESNAALSSPELVQADQAGGDWKSAVQRIDRLISAHPGEERLIAALRVRQALLLTVYKQEALAREAWKLVKPGTLGERDQAFAALSDHLVWWYKRGPETAPLSEPEREKAAGAARDIHARCAVLTPRSDARQFLATMATNISLKRAHDSPRMSPAGKEAVVVVLKEALKAYAGHFDDDDRQWVVDNYSAVVPAGVEVLSQLRHRFAFRDLIKAYKAEAAKIPPPAPQVTWEPAWINSLN